MLFKRRFKNGRVKAAEFKRRESIGASLFFYGLNTMKTVQIIFPQARRCVKNITSRGEEEVKVPFLIV